jgi:hypothetical protein
MRIRRGIKIGALALALAVAVSSLLAASAMALPASFWGTVPQSTLSGEQFQRLSRGGVESVRISIGWGDLQPEEAGPIAWGTVDALVERAALSGIGVLPAITGAPTWAVPDARVPGGGGSTAPAYLPVKGRAAAAWRSFLMQAAHRYGPSGEFWATHPGVPARPIWNWQIWNEPNFKYFVARPNPKEYGQLVKISSSALKAIDPGARILLAGLFSRPKGARTRAGKHRGLNWYASDFVQGMYRGNPGIKSQFNGVALHPYAYYSTELPELIEEFRRVLARNRDAAKGLWITEMGWSSGRPVHSNLFAKGPAGQAAQLTHAFTLLRNKAVPWRIRGIYWFSVDDAPGSCNFCDGSGLFSSPFTPKPSWYAYVRFAGGTP